MGNSLIRRQFDVTALRFHEAVRMAGLPWEVVTIVGVELDEMRAGICLPEFMSATDPLTRDCETFADIKAEIPF